VALDSAVALLALPILLIEGRRPFQARSELELTFAGIATVQITGGGREQQQRVAALEAE
jgi:hypothetical protein